MTNHLLQQIKRTLYFERANGTRITRRPDGVKESLPQDPPQARVTADVRAPIGAVGCMRWLGRLPDNAHTLKIVFTNPCLE